MIFLVQNPEVVEEISQGFINSMCMLPITLRRGDVFTVNRLIMEA